MRSDDLEDYNVVRFVKDTYDRYIEKDWFEGEKRHADGETKSTRCWYKEGHHKEKTMVRIIRTPGHNNLPNFIGKFPQGEDDDSHELYCATMLMLLKPWRDVRSDLKADYETWHDAFESFKSNATIEHLCIVSGVNYMSNCKRKSEERHLPVMDVVMDFTKKSKYEMLRNNEGDNDDIVGEVDVCDQNGRIYDERYYNDLLAGLVSEKQKEFANSAVMRARGETTSRYVHASKSTCIQDRGYSFMKAAPTGMYNIRSNNPTRQRTATYSI